MAKAKYSQSLLLNLLIGFLTASLAVSQPLNVKIINRNPNFPDSKVFLMFGGTSSGLNATATVNGVAGATLAEGASYALSQIDDIKLSSFRGGRIDIALGNRLTSASVDTGYAPNFSNAALPDYHTRWDKVEITYSPGDPGSRANLSAADFFSVPLQVTTFTAASPETPSATLTWRAPTAAIFAKLAALSHSSPVAVVGGSSGIPTPGYGPILRIISPSKVADPSVYPSFKAFVDFVKDQEIATLIWGSHNASQSYRLKAIVDKEGRLVMTGTVSGVPVSETNITIAVRDLLNGIYTWNPPYTVNGSPHNLSMEDPYATAVRDVLGGFALGFIGSTEINPNTGDSFGAGPSNKWYQPPVPLRLAFAGAQPENPGFATNTPAIFRPFQMLMSFPSPI